MVKKKKTPDLKRFFVNSLPIIIIFMINFSVFFFKDFILEILYLKVKGIETLVLEFGE